MCQSWAWRLASPASEDNVYLLTSQRHWSLEKMTVPDSVGVNQHDIYQICPPLAFLGLHYKIMALVSSAVILRAKETSPFQGSLVHLSHTELTNRPGWINQDNNRHSLRGTQLLLSLGQLFKWSPGFRFGFIDSPAVKDFTLHCVHSSNFTFAPPGHQKPQPRVKKHIYTQCTGLPLYLWEHYLNVPYMLVLNTHHRRAKQRLDFRAPGMCPSLSKATEKMMRTWLVGDDSRQLAALLPRDNLKPLDSSCQRLHISGEVKRLRKLKIDTGPTAALK